jgi:hypothetical protein
MQQIGVYMAVHQHTLRSGAAPGADAAFEAGCTANNGKMEIYIPWTGFADREASETVHVGVSPQALRIAQKHHPNWNACQFGARRLHGRNVYQILGLDLKTPVDFVVCWTKGGKRGGGTGQALRIAEALKIPIFDLAVPAAMDALEEFIRRHPDYK